jgi:DeoR family fructose operon transcriptional repressor
LERLESAGNIRRTFGGAVLVGRDIALQERYGFMQEEKMKIGKKAAGLIQPGESVFIDAGTTTLQIARNLPPGVNVTVVTNAVTIAAELMDKQIQTLVTGGMLIDTTAALVGPITERTISGMAFDRIFLGATGVNASHGFSNSNLYEAEIKKVAMRQAEEINIVMDHSKFGAKELFSFAPLSDVHRIVTDRLPAEELRLACEEAGIELVAQ